LKKYWNSGDNGQNLFKLKKILTSGISKNKKIAVMRKKYVDPNHKMCAYVIIKKIDFKSNIFLCCVLD